MFKLLCVNDPEPAAPVETINLMLSEREVPVGGVKENSTSIHCNNNPQFDGSSDEENDDGAGVAALSGVTLFSLPAAGEDDAMSDCRPDEEEEQDYGGLEEDEDEDCGMPENWTFPGFIAFALMGPIVPSTMIALRSELLMTNLPSTASKDPENGRASMRRSVIANKKKENKRRKISQQWEEEETCNSSQVTNPTNSNSLPGAAGEAATITLNHQIMVAGIVQSKMLIDQRSEAQLNDRVIEMHKKRVGGQQILINELKFMIGNTPPNDPEHKLYMQELKVLNKKLADAVAALIKAEEMIVAGYMKQAEMMKKKPPAANFIDLTIAAVLGGEDNPEVVLGEVGVASNSEKNDSLEDSNNDFSTPTATTM